MFKKLLVLLGLRHAPTPIRKYLIASSVVGTVPAVLWLAWRNRERIASMLHRRQHRLEGSFGPETFSTEIA